MRGQVCGNHAFYFNPKGPKIIEEKRPPFQRYSKWLDFHISSSENVTSYDLESRYNWAIP